jgi:hypothetical protein
MVVFEDYNSIGMGFQILLHWIHVGSFLVIFARGIVLAMLLEEFHWRGKEWQYERERHGRSTIPLPLFMLLQLQRHLTDHVSMSQDALERTILCWKFPRGDLCGALLRVEDYASVKLVVHVTIILG